MSQPVNLQVPPLLLHPDSRLFLTLGVGKSVYQVYQGRVRSKTEFWSL